MNDRPTPADIHPDSGCRLPLAPREPLDDAAKQRYDNLLNMKGGTLVGIKGPGGLHFHSPGLTKFSTQTNSYLRYECGFAADVREVAILTAARAMDCQFEWAAHEPQALRDGVPAEVVDIIKHRKPTDGVKEDYAAIIELGREAVARHRVSPETFARITALYGPKQVVELLALIGNYVATAIALIAVDQQLPPDTKAILPVD